VADGGARKGAEEKKQPSGAEPDPVMDIYSVALYGDLDHLRRFMEREGGAGSLSALQLATLNNNPHVALYIIEVHFLLLAGLGTGRCFTPLPFC
jgi:palmitoyltransferase